MREVETRRIVVGRELGLEPARRSNASPPDRIAGRLPPRRRTLAHEPRSRGRSARESTALACRPTCRRWHRLTPGSAAISCWPQGSPAAPQRIVSGDRLLRSVDDQDPSDRYRLDRGHARRERRNPAPGTARMSRKHRRRAPCPRLRKSAKAASAGGSTSKYGCEHMPIFAARPFEDRPEPPRRRRMRRAVGTRVEAIERCGTDAKMHTSHAEKTCNRSLNEAAHAKRLKDLPLASLPRSRQNADVAETWFEAVTTRESSRCNGQRTARGVPWRVERDRKWEQGQFGG